MKTSNLETTKILMIDRDCPICNNNKSSDIFAESTFDISKLDKFSFSSRKIPENMHLGLSLCNNCSLIYANQAPEAGVLHSLYKDAAFDRSEESVFAAKTYCRLFKKYVMPNLKGKATSSKLLDIGAGDGAFLEQIFNLGISQIVGLEPSQAPIDMAHYKVKDKIIKNIFRENQFANDSFDVVTCFQTIEHLPNPLIVAQIVNQILKPGGQFMIVCHNRNALSAKILGKKSPIFDIEHLQLFCPDSIKKLLSNTGFKNCLTHSIINRYSLSYWISLLPISSRTKTLFNKVATALGIDAIPIPMLAGNLVAIGTKE